MTFATAQLAIVLLILSVSAHAQPSQCAALWNFSGSGESVSECRCGTDLKNVTLTPPKGFALTAACGLKKWNETGGAFIDIPARQTVDFDRYDQDGNTSSIGRLYFQGRLRMSGLLRFEPSNGGDLFFEPARPVKMPQSAIEPHFRSFILIPNGQDSTFKLRKSVRAMTCAEARADIVIHDVKVVANDSEEAGAYPRSVEVLRISPYRPCNRN